MTASSKVLVVSRDRRVADAMRMGFEREGMPVVATGTHAEAAALYEDVSVVVAGGDPEAGARSAELIRGLVEAGAERGAPPLLYVGNGVTRGEALAAGASAVLAAPAFVRDVVTIGRILAGRRPGNRSVMDADLAESFGVFYLVRALCATGATGTMLMMRGLRRGEIRFFEGEVTSAQVGGLHGQAALHQLLLWTEARIELRHEPVVRRQQIPLGLDELLAQAEQFLSDLREVAGSLSPASVYEQDAATVGQLGRTLPTEVHGVLRLFDGHRTVADVLEDSPFRVLETLRVAERAAQVGLLRRLVTTRARSVHRAMLAIEEWLVGGAGEVGAPVVPASSAGSGPVAAGKGQAGVSGKKKGKHKKGSGSVPIAEPARSHVEVDWAALVPRGTGLDSGALSPVVPSAAAKGEIETRTGRASRDDEREKLEELTDASARDRLFSGAKVVSEEVSEDEAREWLAAKERADAAAAAEEAARVKAEAEAKARADADAKAAAEAEERARAEAAAKARADAEAAAKAQAEAEARAKAEAEAEAKARAEAEAKAYAEEMERRRERRVSGEIASVTAAREPAMAGPTILVEELTDTRDDAARLATAAVAAAAARAPSAPPVDVAATAAATAPAAEVAVARADARKAEAAVGTHFTDEEEAFFQAGHAAPPAVHHDPAESFADLDDGHQPQGFWDRLLGRKPRPLPGARTKK